MALGLPNTPDQALDLGPVWVGLVGYGMVVGAGVVEALGLSLSRLLLHPSNVDCLYNAYAPTSGFP